MRQFRIGGTDRADQCIDHFALDAIVQMAGIRHILETAPAVGNFLVLGKRIGDQRKASLVGLEGLGQRLRRGLSLLSATILQEAQRRLDGELISPDLEAQARDGLVEQPVPGGVTALGLLMKQLLDAILELIRSVLAQVLDPRAIMRQFRGLHGAVDDRIIDAVEFEREEQQMHRRVRQVLGDVTVEFRDHRIDTVAGMDEAGI